MFHFLRRYRATQVGLIALGGAALLLVLAVLFIRSDQRADSAATVEAVTNHLIADRELAVALQDERAAVATDSGIDAARDRTDRVMDAVVDRDPESVEAVQSARESDDAISAVGDYNEVILALLSRSVASDPALFPDTESRQLVEVAGSLAALREAISVEAAQAISGSAAELTDAQNLTDGWVDAVQLGAPNSAFRDLQLLAGFDAMNALREAEADVQSPTADDADEARLEALISSRLDASRAVIERTHGEAQQSLAGVTDAHLRNRILEPGFVVVALLFAAGIWQFAVARSEWTERKFSSTLLDIANNDFDELLATVDAGETHEAMVYPVEAPASLGDAAEAFVQLQEKAMNQAIDRVAGEERTNETIAAAAHRTRQLIADQREALAELHTVEVDADGSEALERLTHLVERASANNERLLVLSGSAALPVEVVGASTLSAVIAAAERSCQESKRLEIAISDDLAIPAALAQDLIIVVRELLDNALAYSPPPSTVALSGHNIDGSYVLWIRDHGMGIDDEHLNVLNADLSHGRRLSTLGGDGAGMAVVGELAVRHSLRVSLLAGDESGVQARIEIPAGMIMSPVESVPEAAAGLPDTNPLDAGPFDFDTTALVDPALVDPALIDPAGVGATRSLSQRLATEFGGRDA